MLLPQAHTWFEASVGEHRLRLGLEACATTAPHAAIALYQVDATLQAIAQWLGSDPAWQWLDSPVTTSQVSPESIPPAALSSPDTKVMLDLPAALEQALPPAPAALTAKLKAPALPVQLVAARFRLSGEEANMLEPGGAIMLGESTETVWHGFLRSAEVADRPVIIHAPERVERRPVNERFSNEPAAISTNSLPSHINPSGLNVEIRLGGPVNVPTICLRDEFDGAVDLSGASSHTRLASLWLAGDPVAPLAVGELTPLGRGWAMLIEQVLSADTTEVLTAEAPSPHQ